MRDRETIDSELRRIVLGRRSVHAHDPRPSIREIDALLDERLGHRAEADVVADLPSERVQTDRIKPSKRKGALRRFGPVAALSVSLGAVAALVMLISSAHKPPPAAEAPLAPPPPSAQPSPPPPEALPSPEAHAPRVDIVDRALVATLKHEGVPVPSDEYVTTHGHAVCDFLSQQSNFTEAVSFVQRSSIWDANESTNVAAGAVVSYCPEYERASLAEPQPGVGNALPDLPAVQRDLQGIEGDLKGIRDGLQGITGSQ
jgi:Protein of unknown function (DUF732)